MKRLKISNKELQKEFKNKYPLCNDPICELIDYTIQKEIDIIYSKQIKKQFNTIFKNGK